MTLPLRRIIYLIFIVIFLLITPVVILYTAGYRYNFQTNRIQKTGIIILKSNPAGAEIYLNGKLRTEKTPARITNLLPDDYTVKIEKENFYPWQKTLSVKSGLTTFAENITLFEKNLPAEVVETNSGLFSLAPNKEKIIYLNEKETGDEVWLLNFRNNKNSLVYRISEEKSNIVNLEWSNDNQKILLTIDFPDAAESHKYILINTDTGEISVYQKLSDFYFTFRGVPINIANPHRLPNLDLSSGYSSMVAVLDKEAKHLAVIQPSSLDPLFETRADQMAWSIDGGKLLYTIDFEIWIYNFSTKEKTFISRYGQEIKKIDWINENYIAILLNGTVKIIELDERDQRNIVDILTPEEINNFSVNGIKQSIYFSGIVGNKKGVFELPY
ncbi:MAG: PEGA domain-containing protein [Patescibacteria group bacterium]